MTAEQPALDLSQIEFPSDQLSLGVLRKHYGTSEHFLDNGSAIVRLGLLAESERDFAEIVFEEAMTSVAWEDLNRRNGLIGGMKQCDEETMSRDYQEYGLARGPHEARELIRSFEAAVRAQAKSHGKGR